MLASRIGYGRPRAQLHPIASDMLADGRTPSLLDIAKQACISSYGPSARSWDMREILGSGVGTDHLAAVLTGVANDIVLARSSDLLSKILKITRAVDARDYRPQNVGTVELDAAISPPSPALREWQNAVPGGAGEDLQMGLAPIRLRFSEQLVVNDDAGAISATVEAVLVAAAQNELSQLFDLLNTSQILSDGSPLFSVAAGTLLESQSKDATAIGGALALLRSQSVNGQPAGVDPALLLVPAADEIAARLIIAAASGLEQIVEVIATSYLDSGAWILLSDPSIWPVFVRGCPVGADGQSLTFTRGRPNEREGSRDTILEGLHSVGFGVASRIGAVKIEVS